MKNRTLWSVALVALLAALPACIGIRSNKDAFLNDPAVGTSVVQMLATFGKPDYSTTVGDQTVYIYRILDDGYYVLFGSSDRIDLVVTATNGSVTESKRVKVGRDLAILQPSTWQVN